MYKHRINFLYIFFSLLILFSLHAQSESPIHPVDLSSKFFLSSEHLEKRGWLLNESWKYHPGDNTEWAKPDFNDSLWDIVNPELRPNGLPLDGWHGTGWFRLHLLVDSTLVNQPLGLFIWQAGTSQMYFNGELLYTFGEQEGDWTGVPKEIVFDGRESHVIAIRYTNTSIDKYHNAGSSAGFYLGLDKLNKMVQDTVQRKTTFTAFQMFFTSLPLAIALLHLFLFAFFPAIRQNLYFALFLTAYAATIYFDYQMLLSSGIDQNLFYLRMHCAALPFWILFKLWLVYSLFRLKLPIQFWVISMAAFIAGSLAVYKPTPYFEFFGIIYIATYLEIIRVIIMAFVKKYEGTWIIAMGFLVFFMSGILDTLMDEGVIVSLREIENPYAWGSVGFIIAMSVYLSRDFARANKKIANQEIERKLLEAENIRQTKELEEARQLQLSMLPETVPNHPDYDIAVYMQTATEVGGDYYDFHLVDNGVLTVAVGDATGHGMKAGIMVASMKSLFGTYDESLDIPQFLNHCSDIIRKMKLGNLYMAMMLVRIDGHKITISSAGMPPALIYRNETKTVEELVIKGMPLGGPSQTPYQIKETDIRAGDTILLMSDGLPELFNDKDEMLDYPRIQEIFKEAVDKSAKEIITELTKAGDRWRNGRPQDDDITFVVLKR